MCTEEQKDKEIATLEKIAKLLDSRHPVDTTILLDDTRPWTVDYRGFKHIFLWIPGSALTLVCGEYGTGPVQAQVWVNLGFRAGTNITTSGQSSNVPIIVRFTDEEVP